MARQFWFQVSAGLALGLALLCGRAQADVTYSISGIITSSGSALAGVTVTPSPSGAAATTDASGSYTISGLAAGTYTITPSLLGYAFSPTAITGVTVAPDATGKDFTATPTTTVTIGSGTSAEIFPMGTYYKKGRTQVIYLASEIGTAGNITALALDVKTVPGLAMANWTIRMKHTALTGYPAPVLEGSGWTTVYQEASAAPGAAGWRTFTFSTPFAYNGTDNLLIDFSFSNTSYAVDGKCRYTGWGGYERTIIVRCDSGDPLAWSETNPPPDHPISRSEVPNVRLTLAPETTYSISGTITCGGSALAGVTVTPLPSGAAATTDASGNYTISNLAAGDYIITPSLTGYDFASSAVIVGPSVTDEDFTATANSYLVTFNAQGGTDPNPASKLVTSGSAYGTLATTASPGYTFAGWWTDAGGTATEVTAATTVAITAAQTLYAKWLPNSCLVTFNAQGGTSPVPASTSVTYDSAYGTLAATTRTGYAFAGWYTGATGTGTQVTATTVVATAADHTLYAKWTANSYTVTFDAQGGTAASPASTSVTYGSAYGTLAGTARPGYTFGGWWTDAGGTATEVTAATTVAITAAQTLYAKWTANSYTVTFDAQGGTAASPASTSVTYGSAYGTLAGTSRPGYTFAGWWTDATGTGTQVTASMVVSTAASQTLYAKYFALPAQITTASAFTGTVTVAANWVDFSVSDADDTNCNDWVSFPVTYNAYLVLCYGEILCPVCPFPVTDAWLWLVDKKGKQVYAASLEDGGITDAQGYCFGNGNVGVTFATFLPYADREGLTGFDYTTSPAVTFALAGTREKASGTAAVNILRLTGGATLFTVSPAENADRLAALECEDGSELAVVTASFKKSSARVKPDPYCPECTTNCDSVYAAQLAFVAKSAKKYFWWDILGEGDVQPAVK